MEDMKQMKLQVLGMAVAGFALTVFAALHQNTILAVIIFAAQGTLGSVINAKYRNEVFRLIAQRDEGIYNDLLQTADISPKAAKREGRDYGEEIDRLLISYLRMQKINTWLPILEVLLFFALQVALFSNL